MGKEALRDLLFENLDWLTDHEAGKLRKAVEERQGFVTGDANMGAEVLLELGLVRPSGKSEGLHKDEHYYEPTEKGKKVYDAIFG